nr:uncharacterized protein LOC127329261 [Lolium perenne]
MMCIFFNTCTICRLLQYLRIYSFSSSNIRSMPGMGYLHRLQQLQQLVFDSKIARLHSIRVFHLHSSSSSGASLREVADAKGGRSPAHRRGPVSFTGWPAGSSQRGVRDSADTRRRGARDSAGARLRGVRDSAGVRLRGARDSSGAKLRGAWISGGGAEFRRHQAARGGEFRWCQGGAIRRRESPAARLHGARNSGVVSGARSAGGNQLQRARTRDPGRYDWGFDCDVFEILRIQLQITLAHRHLFRAGGSIFSCKIS